nr:reverse transcriptase domain-containing protein [Tanacetum cinerariifolium]
ATMDGTGSPITPMTIQAIDFGLKNHMIQQVQQSCQYYSLPGDDANKHIDKFLTVTQSMKQNGVPYDLEETVTKFLSKYFPPSMVIKLRNDISNFRQLPDESLYEACERYKLPIDRFPNHNMLPITQIDIFYNELTLRHRDTINVAVGGTFIKRRPKECYDLIENMTSHKNDWDTSAQMGKSSRSITSSSLEIEALTQQISKMNKNFLRMSQSNQQVNVVNLSCETCGGPHHYSECQATNSFTQGGVYVDTGNYNVRGGKDAETTMDQVYVPSSESTALVPSPMFKKLHFSISFAEALAQIPKYAKMLKDLLTNNEKLPELANTPLNENFLAVLLKKLPEKLGDHRKFLIPCDFSKLEECLALADLELANRSVAYPAGIFEDVFVKVGRPFLRVARALVDVFGEELILRVRDEKLAFNVNSTSKYPHKHKNELINLIDIIDTTREDHFHKMLQVQKSIHPLSGSPTPFSDPIVASLFPSLTSFEDSDSLLEETNAFLALDSIPPDIDNRIYALEGDILLFEKLLNDEPSEAEKSEINPLIREPSNTFLMGDNLKRAKMGHNNGGVPRNPYSV